MGEPSSLGRSHNIQTYAVLDLETTGLPHQEANTTRITELSVIAVTRKHVIEAEATEEKLPRVQQKLTLCFNPNKMISPVASEISELNNHNLEECGPFDENVFIMLESFFKRLSQPVCIIAHNGLKFDFPILQSELDRLRKRLPDGLLCADSLTAFRELLGQKALDKEAQLHQHLRERDDYGARQENGAGKLDNRGTKRSLDERDNDKLLTHNKVLKKFKLGDIYEHLLDKQPTNSHQAEGDTLSLLQCIIAKSIQFTEWADTNAKLFNNVKGLPQYTT